jgi:hypothetical protein
MAKVKVKQSVAKAITSGTKTVAKPATKKESPSWTKTLGRKGILDKEKEMQ